MFWVQTLLQTNTHMSLKCKKKPEHPKGAHKTTVRMCNLHTASTAGNECWSLDAAALLAVPLSTEFNKYSRTVVLCFQHWIFFPFFSFGILGFIIFSELCLTDLFHSPFSFSQNYYWNPFSRPDFHSIADLSFSLCPPSILLRIWKLVFQVHNKDNWPVALTCFSTVACPLLISILFFPLLFLFVQLIGFIHLFGIQSSEYIEVTNSAVWLQHMHCLER